MESALREHREPPEVSKPPPPPIFNTFLYATVYIQYHMTVEVSHEFCRYATKFEGLMYRMVLIPYRLFEERAGPPRGGGGRGGC